MIKPSAKPYVIMLNKHDVTKKFALDRNYVLIPSEKCNPPIDEIYLKDIIEVDHQFFPTFEYQYPEWVTDEMKTEFVALWTNYYE